VGKDAAFEVFAKCFAHVGLGRVVVALAVELACAGQLKPGLDVVGYGLVEQGALRMAGVVEFGFARGCSSQLATIQSMYNVIETEGFSAWLAGLKDRITRTRLTLRLRKAALGNLGDIKSVGDSVFEMREHFGPGWRMYYVEQAGVIIVMLAGGDKTSQSKDIQRAIAMAKELQ
jgi:putative addiction module killer protein